MTLYPSEKIHDWEIFTWKKGDILKCGLAYIIFNGFKDDEYFLIKGKWFNEFYDFVPGNGYYYTYCENGGGMTCYFVKIEDELYARKKRKIFKKLAGQRIITRWRQIKLKNKR